MSRIKQIEGISLHRWLVGFVSYGHGGNNVEWILKGFADILEILDLGYLCFCGHFNTDDDMCNHSPDDEEEWRNENGKL